MRRLPRSLGALLLVGGCFLLVESGGCSSSAPKDDSQGASAETTGGFDTSICGTSGSMPNMAGAGSPDCVYYCQSCLGINQPDVNALVARFQADAKLIWTGTYLSWVASFYQSLVQEAATSGAPIELPPVSSNITSGLSGLSIGACIGMSMSAIVGVIEYFGQQATPEAAYTPSGGQALCGLVWATNACTSQLTLDPTVWAAIKGLSLTCTAGNFAANKIVCNATESACQSEVAAAQPLIAGNECCCQASDGTWSIAQEHPCLDSGGQFRAGTCGDAVPFSADQCPYLVARLNGDVPGDDGGGAVVGADDDGGADWSGDDGDGGTGGGGGDWTDEDAGDNGAGTDPSSNVHRKVRTHAPAARAR